MSQEMRQKANRNACADLVRQAHTVLTSAIQNTQDVLQGISQAMKLVEKAQKLAEAQPVPGSRKQPARVRAKLVRAAAVLAKLEADIRSVPATGLEKAVAAKRVRDRRRHEEDGRASSAVIGSPVRILPMKAKRRAPRTV